MIAIEYMEDRDKQDILDAISLMAEQMHTMGEHIVHVKSQMVTKSYLDDKLGQLRGDLVILARKGNTKLSTLIEDLVSEGSLKREIADRLLAMEPFPPLSMSV